MWGPPHVCGPFLNEHSLHVGALSTLHHINSKNDGEFELASLIEIIFNNVKIKTK